MKDKTLKILLGIIAVNLTIQTVKGVGLFPTAYAQSGIQRVAICDLDDSYKCTRVGSVNADGSGAGVFYTRDYYEVRYGRN